MGEPGPRVAALVTAAEAARGHLGEDLLAQARLTAERATSRLRLPADHTIVAIAGSTGSGKSTTFNLLAGADLSVSGAQRPTTSEATALVWSDADVSEILDWLGVPPGRQHRRADLRPAPPRHRLPDGLVLLDLPDHDSVESAHHREAERVVALADLLIWVVDPQKYADAAIHRRFLRPLSGHRDVTMVVLNHLDTVAEDRRPEMLRDLRRVLVADGIRDPRILGMSAREGLGTDELRTAVRRRVEERPNVALRVEADVRAAARRLLDAAGDAPRELPDGWVGDLERRVADAAGVPAAVARARRDPHAALRVGPVDRPAVDTAVRALADRLCADLGEAWAGPLRSAATRHLAETDERLDAELAALRFPDEGPGAVRALGLARAGLVAGAVLSALLVLVSGLAAISLGACLAGALGAHLAARRAADRAAQRRGAEVQADCQAVIARVLRAQVVDPVRVELASYGRFRRAVDVAVR